MATTSYHEIERELYAARFRRNLNSLTKEINNPKKSLQRVVAKSNRTGKAIMVMMPPRAYVETVSHVNRHQQWLSEQVK